MKKTFTFIFLLLLFISGVSFFTVWENTTRELAQQSATQTEQMASETATAVLDSELDLNAQIDPMLVEIPQDMSETTASKLDQVATKAHVEIKKIAPTADNTIQESKPVAQEKEVISFSTGGSTLGQQQKSALSALAQVLQKDTDKIANIAGFSDSIGSAQINEKVSLARAVSVEKFFRGQGIPSEQLKIQSHGSASPIASNLTAAGRRQNRRVEIILK